MFIHDRELEQIIIKAGLKADDPILKEGATLLGSGSVIMFDQQLGKKIKCTGEIVYLNNGPFILLVKNNHPRLIPYKKIIDVRYSPRKR